MKKAIVFSLAVVCASSSFAQATRKPVKELACAVMPSMKVNIKQATAKKMYADYKGRRYFFCCDGCPPAFKKNPAKFASNPSIKIPKVKKG